MEKIDKNSIERFWSRVKKTKSCWIWVGRKHVQGYGFISIFGKDELAHRVSYFLEFNKLPKNKFICHRCDNPSCIRPSHLFLGTQKDNMRDMVKKGRNADNTGEKNPNSILSKKDVIEIKKFLKLKFTYKEIAKRFGVSYGTINNIVSRYAWGHL